MGFLHGLYGAAPPGDPAAVAPVDGARPAVLSVIGTVEKDEDAAVGADGAAGAFKTLPMHIVVAGGAPRDARHSVPSLQAQREFAQSAFQKRHASGAAAVAPPPRRRRCVPRCAERCAVPRLASPFPGWRSVLALALSFALALLLDAYPGTLTLSWAVAWPTALLAIVAEAFYVVDTMDGKDPNGAAPLIGVAGLARLFDLWLSWAITCGNIFMCFWLFDVHGKHFGGGLGALARNSSALEALSFFLPFSVTACAGGGLAYLEPATAVARYATTAFTAVTFVFVVVIVYTNTSEALLRRDRRVEAS